MIKNIPPNIESTLYADAKDFEATINKIRTEESRAVKYMLNSNFNKYKANATKEESIVFLLQFAKVIPDLALLRSEEIFKVFDELNFGHAVKKWFVNLDEIVSEINKIYHIDGVIFLRNAFLMAIQAHIQSKVFIHLLERFNLDANYNNQEVNELFIDMYNRYRRRTSNENKKQTGKMDSFEKQMHKYIDDLEEKTKDKALARKVSLKFYQGDTSFALMLLDSFFCKGISRRKVYLEMFPLLTMIIKDYPFLTNDQFFRAKDSGYDGDYNNYKISCLNTIFKKK